MKKTFTFIISLLICAVLLCSCAAKNTYRDDIPCSDIITALENEMATAGGYVHLGDTELQIIFGDDISLAKDRSVSYSLLSENVDEFGIFKTDSEKSTIELAEECLDYIEEKYENENAFIASYAPEELPKLKDAEVKTFGNYVAFAILNESDRAAFFEKVEEMLIVN